MQRGALRRGRRRGRNPPDRSCATVGARGNYVNPRPTATIHDRACRSPRSPEQAQALREVAVKDWSVRISTCMQGLDIFIPPQVCKRHTAIS